MSDVKPPLPAPAAGGRAARHRVCWSRWWSAPGIAAAELSPDDVGLQLLENSIATVFGLAVLILMLRAGVRGALQPGGLGRGLVLGRGAGDRPARS